MNHAGTLPLETDRLRLRRITPADAEGLYAMFGDPRVVKYLHLQAYTDFSQAVDSIAGSIEDYSKPSWYYWVIEVKATGAFAGTIDLGTHSDIDETADVGYTLLHSMWGNGYAAEALRAVLGFAFFTVGYNRVQASHSTQNPASGCVMRKAGMLYEGMARESHKNALGYHDCHNYGMLKKDF